MKILIRNIILGFVLTNLFCSLCFSQNNYSQHYLPQYNLWLPGSTNYNNKSVIIPYKNPPKSEITDTIFLWHYVYLCSGNEISKVDFVDSLYGWVIDYNVGVCKTTDSGFNWDTSIIVSGLGGEISFINRNIGWAVGSTVPVGYHQETLIRKTTNGGVSWINQDWPIDTSFQPLYRCVHFFNENTGIVAGDGYQNHYIFIIKTIDGGNNWNIIYSPYTPDTIGGGIYRQFWINDDTGWFCGQDELLKTTNQGLNFISYLSHVPPNSNGHLGILDIYFLNEDTGWVTTGGIAYDENLFKTTDAGVTWNFQINPIYYYDYAQIDGIIFINPDTGFASSYVGIIIATTNGGTNWFTNQVINDWTFHFSVYDNSKVWLGGSGKIWFTNIQNPIGIMNHSTQNPASFKLFDNYPNPFNPSTIIKYEVPRSSKIEIIIYDLLGNEVIKLIDQKENPGSYKITWNASAFASGVYFYSLIYDEGIITKKLVFLK